jgi:adenylyltransferase/sulfurtransferase
VHRNDSIGKPKAASAAATLSQVNPEIRVEALEERASPERLLALVRGADVVLDCSDNFATRHALNRACVAHRKPLVSGAAIRFDGQVAVFDLRRDDAPCYHCLFAEEAQSEEERCATMGVFAPLVGVVGTLQAMEAIKLITGVGDTLAGRLMLFDALASRWHEVRLARDPACRVCGAHRAAA